MAKWRRYQQYPYHYNAGHTGSAYRYEQGLVFIDVHRGIAGKDSTPWSAWIVIGDDDSCRVMDAFINQHRTAKEAKAAALRIVDAYLAVDGTHTKEATSNG